MRPPNLETFQNTLFQIRVVLLNRATEEILQQCKVVDWNLIFILEIPTKTKILNLHKTHCSKFLVEQIKYL